MRTAPSPQRPKLRPLPDPRLDALATFTRIIVEKRGMPEKSEVDTFLAAGFTPKHVLGIVQAITCKTYSNFVNYLAATEVDAAFADYKVTAYVKSPAKLAGLFHLVCQLTISVSATLAASR